MSGFILKTAETDVEHVVDWSKGYLADREKITADLGWAIQPDHGGTDLRVAFQGHDARRSRVVLTGGAPGRFHHVSNRVRTTDDRVLCQSIIVRIAQSAAE